jgi:hypothetical protein
VGQVTIGPVGARDLPPVSLHRPRLIGDLPELIRRNPVIA